MLLKASRMNEECAALIALRCCHCPRGSGKDCIHIHINKSGSLIIILVNRGKLEIPIINVICMFNTTLAPISPEYQTKRLFILGVFR